MEKNLTNNQVLLKECIEQDYKENNTYSDINTFFEFFAASQVLKNYNLSDEEIENGVVGGGNDGGCDGLYIFLNDELVNADQLESLAASKGATLEFCIIQAKNVFGFKEDAIMKWKTVSENLLSMSNPMTNYSGILWQFGYQGSGETGGLVVKSIYFCSKYTFTVVNVLNLE